MKTSDILVYAFILLVIVTLFIFSDTPVVQKFGAISTVLLTVLTAGYVILTHMILRSTRELAQEQTRPYVVATLPLDGFQLLLSIKNVGNRPAANVEVKFRPSLETIAPDFLDRGKPLLFQSFMPPNFEVRNPIAVTIEILKLKPEQKRIHADIAYRDTLGEEYSEQYEIDLNSYVFDKSVVQYTLEHHLDAISKSLKTLAEKR